MVDESARTVNRDRRVALGEKIAITGSTGFVGTALVERLLRSVPDCHLVLLIRDGKRTSAAERARKEILKNDAFDRLRESTAPTSTRWSPAGSPRWPATSPATGSA